MTDQEVIDVKNKLYKAVNEWGDMVDKYGPATDVDIAFLDAACKLVQSWGKQS